MIGSVSGVPTLAGLETPSRAVAFPSPPGGAGSFPSPPPSAEITASAFPTMSEIDLPVWAVLPYPLRDTGDPFLNDLMRSAYESMNERHAWPRFVSDDPHINELARSAERIMYEGYGVSPRSNPLHPLAGLNLSEGDAVPPAPSRTIRSSAT